MIEHEEIARGLCVLSDSVHLYLGACGLWQCSREDRNRHGDRLARPAIAEPQDAQHERYEQLTSRIADIRLVAIGLAATLRKEGRDRDLIRRLLEFADGCRYYATQAELTQVGDRWRPLRDELEAESLVLSTSPSPPPTAAEVPRNAPPPGWESRCGGLLWCLPDLSVVRFPHGEAFHLASENRQNVVRLLIGEWEVGRREVGKQELLNVTDSETADLKGVFKSGKDTVPAWGRLLVLAAHPDGRQRRGQYRLNLPDPGA